MKNKAIGWLVLAVIFLLSLGLLVYSYRINKRVTKQKTRQTAAVRLDSDGLPKEIYNYNGEVLKVDKGVITMMALKKANYLLKDKELKVKTNDKTKFVKLSVPQSIPDLKPGQSGQYFTRQSIKLNDIKVGDKVTVIALENIKNKTEFTAAIVEVYGSKK